MRGAARFWSQLLFLRGGPDELSVFGYVMFFQLLAIIGLVVVCGSKAFSRPW